MRPAPRILGPALVSAGALGVDGGQLVEKAARGFFDHGESGGGGSETCAHRPDALGGFLPGWQRVGQLAFAVRGRPGDLRLLPAAARVRALPGFLGALKAAAGGHQQCLRALDGLKGILVRAGHQTAELSDELLDLFFTLVGRKLTLVGVVLPLVGRAFPLVGEGLAPVGRALALVGLTLALLGEGFAYVGRTLALAQALGWLRCCLAVAVHALRMPWCGETRQAQGPG